MALPSMISAAVSLKGSDQQVHPGPELALKFSVIFSNLQDCTGCNHSVTVEIYSTSEQELMDFINKVDV